MHECVSTSFWFVHDSALIVVVRMTNLSLHKRYPNGDCRLEPETSGIRARALQASEWDYRETVITIRLDTIYFATIYYYSTKTTVARQTASAAYADLNPTPLGRAGGQTEATATRRQKGQRRFGKIIIKDSRRQRRTGPIACPEGLGETLASGGPWPTKGTSNTY